MKTSALAALMLVFFARETPAFCAEETSTPPAAPAPASKSLIPDDQIQKLASLVQADQLADARKLAFAFTLLYPEDVRGKEWQTRLDQLAASTKPTVTTVGESAPLKPSPAAEDDAIKRQVDRELRVIKLAHADAQKLKDDKGEATEPYYQALDAILARPDPFKSESPAQIPYYATRAQLALEAGDPWSGFPAAAKLNDLGADKLSEEAYVDLYAKLDGRGWLGTDIQTYLIDYEGDYAITSFETIIDKDRGCIPSLNSGTINLKFRKDALNETTSKNTCGKIIWISSDNARGSKFKYEVEFTLPRKPKFADKKLLLKATIATTAVWTGYEQSWRPFDPVPYDYNAQFTILDKLTAKITVALDNKNIITATARRQTKQ